MYMLIYSKTFVLRTPYSIKIPYFMNLASGPYPISNVAHELYPRFNEHWIYGEPGICKPEFNSLDFVNCKRGAARKQWNVFLLNSKFHLVYRPYGSHGSNSFIFAPNNISDAFDQHRHGCTSE